MMSEAQIKQMLEEEEAKLKRIQQEAKDEMDANHWRISIELTHSEAPVKKRIDFLKEILQ
jgi:hypothetical protein